MHGSDKIEGLAEAFLAAHEAAKRDGTPEMQSLTKILLYLVGSKLAELQAETLNPDQRAPDR